jgi:hypothetical protein
VYIIVAIYDTDANFLGYTIKDADPAIVKLQSTNLWLESEIDKLQEQLNRLNQAVDLRLYWPNPKDPEVLAILANPDFMPIEYIEMEMVDDEHSYYVWVQEPEYDPATGEPTGRMVDGSVLDEQASVIRYKMGIVPARPSDELYRIKGACELVARQRAGLVESGDV